MRSPTERADLRPVDGVAQVVPRTIVDVADHVIAVSDVRQDPACQRPLSISC